uniref:Uncharacterized protein n=1 Tax=Anopheles maculatus TaxID=74869 RepID=A0A182SPQ6_9DIPT
VLNQIKFQGPTAKAEQPAKKPTAAVNGPASAGSSYKPYHSVLTNNARAGSVVAAAKAKIASEKSNGTASATTTTTTKKLPSQANASVRTRTPSPRGSIANGSLPNGTVPGKATATASSAAASSTTGGGTKPKTAAKPATIHGNGKLLTAAARPGPGKVSNVASLQQKFEGRK